MLKIKSVFILFLVLLIQSHTVVLADLYHYQDLLIGERASGLGGAYSAVSDDPSGTLYNPAGLAFADKSYISISMNTFKSSQYNMYNVLVLPAQDGNNNYQMKSSTFIPSFFGMMQDFDKLKVAFSVITPKASIFNQDNHAVFQYSIVTKNPTEFIRNYNEKDFFYMIGPSVAGLISESFSIGASLFVTMTDREWISNQYIKKANYVVTGENSWLWQNDYLEESSLGVMGILGFQYMPSKQLACSFVVKNGYDSFVNWEGQSIVSSTNSSVMPALTKYRVNAKEMGYSKVPLSFTAGTAYFFSPTLLWTFDLNYYPEYIAPVSNFSRKEVYNLSTGIEYYITNNLPIRVGIYSNNSNLARFYDSAYDISLLGTTLSLGWESEFSTLSLGVDYSFGNGNTFLNNSYFNSDIQNLSISFSGSYMM